MTQHDQNAPAQASFTMAHVFGIALAAMMVLTIGSYAWRNWSTPRGGIDCEEQETQTGEQDNHEFRKWDKPRVALVVTGQMHGYVDPCGCSEPQFGGLIRRYNFMQALLTGAVTKNSARWDVVGIDVGELAQVQGIQAQNLLKFDLSVKSLARMNYRAFGIGRDEVLLPLADGLAQIWDKKNAHPRPLLAAVAAGQQLADLNVRPYEIIDSNPRIGVINLMGPDLRDELKDQLKFLNNQVELAAALDAFAKAEVEIGIILHHEYPKLDEIQFPKGGIKRLTEIEKVRKQQALKCAESCDAERQKNPKVPPILLVVTLTESSEAAFALRELAPTKTKVLEVGHKGKYAGLIGIFGEKGSYRLDYEPVLMGPEWKTKDADRQGHPIIAQFQDYNDKLKTQDMLARFPRSPHISQVPAANAKGLKATYVGSERCADCHEHASKVWNGTKDKVAHFKATKTLEDLTFPSGRHHDPECMKCHTTGFKNPGGYYDLVTDLANWPAKPAQPADAKKVKKHNVNLRGVGCESCHGPGSAHVNDPDNQAIRDLMNPHRVSPEERKLVAALEANPKNAKALSDLKGLYDGTQKRAMARSCMVCHDSENDVNFGNQGHELFDKWISKKLYHHTPKNNNGGALPKKGGPVVADEPPPLVIEVIEEKKK